MRRFTTEMKTGGKLAGIEFGDPIKPFAAVWIHATGFNAMTYQSLLAPLGLRQRVAALDMRGHGCSTMQAKPGRMKSWHRYRDDVIEWLEKEAPHGVVLSGHSMGATVALLVAGKRPDLVKGLVLADPVILPRVFYFWKHVFRRFPGSLIAIPLRAVQRSAGRVSEFPECAGILHRPGAFASWREPFLADYLLDGIERIDHNGADTENQTWRLTCEPKWEAATFAAQRNRPWHALKKVRKHKIPIIVLRPNRSSVISPKVRAQMILMNQALMMKGVRGTSHFLPMEAPYEVRDALSAFIARLVERFTLEEDSDVARSLSVRRRRA